MNIPDAKHQARLEPVKDKDGNNVLYDMYVGDVWHGSRRTPNQCMQYFANRKIRA